MTSSASLRVSTPKGGRLGPGSSFLARRSDVSFVDYLCHMFFVAAFENVLVFAALPLTAATVLKWFLSVAESFIFCVLTGRLLPKKIAGWLGC